jgi:hypothetical protein
MVSVHFRAKSLWFHTRFRVSILFYYPRECHLRSHQSSFQSRSLYPEGRCPPSTSELQEVIFNPGHVTKLSGQEDHVTKHNPRRVVRNRQILQGTLPPTRMGEEKLHGDREVFLGSIVPKSSALHGQCIYHRFLCPLRKSQDEISFKRGGL